ncbi:ATP-binding response regulator [Polyangium jinanense]|uniref:Response regulator n=1 Tax=Polyangium jinanense TaxID=2829994 RepID=A0A9X3X2Z6_9BACT|nr:hybrid sensor histidine kinase/response regulator [Polyangium jinanense]MDC3955254.1 response regulator [Polyangium jinanense]MDC3981555.1 response regulator [Polyangium jinanense]
MSDFLEESELLIDSMVQSRDSLRACPSNPSALRGLSRDAHTLRGILLMVDLPALRDLACRLEEAVGTLRREAGRSPDDALRLVDEAVKALAELKRGAAKGRSHAPARAEMRGHEAVPMARSRTVLIVDDSRTVLRVAQRALEEAGFRALTANTPAAAVEAISREQPALILLDLSIAEQDAGVLLGRLSRDGVFHRTPVVLFSNQPDTLLRATAKRLGAAGHLRKTGDARAIVAAVSAQLERPARTSGGS